MSDNFRSLITGALIGFLSSSGTLLLERLIDKVGGIKIYYKFIYLKNSDHSWYIGEKENKTGYILIIPAVFEFQNNSNTTRIIRDLDIELYNKKEPIKRMVQIEYTEFTATSNGKKTEQSTSNYGGDMRSYSFVLPPKSIQKQKCEFAYSMPKECAEQYAFDTLMITYYDEKNKKHVFPAKTNLSGWKTAYHKADSDWILLKRRFKKKKR